MNLTVPSIGRSLVLAMLVLALCWLLPGHPAGSQAQEVKIAISSDGSAPATAVPAMPPGGPPPGTPGGPPGAPPPGAVPGQPPDPNAKPPDAAKPVEPVKRPVEPSKPADPRELDVRPDADGKISFSFTGQPWPAVLEWLADVSEMSLHWEEAPPGYLDLTTRGRYSLDKVRDLINSVLLAKGFTLLKNGEILVVANLKTLDVSLVPRVTMDELDSRGTYELVKVFVDLDWLVAETAAEEFKGLLSSYGKVTALKSTNRLDILETAGNLQRLKELLTEEQSDRGQKRLIRVFKLKHVRARDVLDTLNTLLGMESKGSAGGPMSPEQQMMAQQQAQQAMMMAQQQAQAGGQPPPGAKKDQPVYLAVNQRENSILANAPPDKMAIIEQAILAVDLEQERSQSLLNNLPRMQVYRLSGINPETLVKVLNDLGGMDPTTKLEVDTKNKSIIAYAPLVDHLTIQSVVDKLDGSGRRFEVIQLRTLSAEYVAGSIEVLMNPPAEDNQQRNRYRWYYDPWENQQQEESKDKFRVEADIEHNRLLLRANDIELAEIGELLQKLGEIPSDERSASTTRIIPGSTGDETEQFIERLRRMWPSMGDNPLEIDVIEDTRSKKPKGKQPGAKPANTSKGTDRPAGQLKRPAKTKKGDESRSADGRSVDRGPGGTDRGPWTVDRGPGKGPWTVDREPGGNSDRGPWTVDRGPGGNTVNAAYVRPADDDTADSDDEVDEENATSDGEISDSDIEDSAAEESDTADIDPEESDAYESDADESDTDDSTVHGPRSTVHDSDGPRSTVHDSDISDSEREAAERLFSQHEEAAREERGKAPIRIMIGPDGLVIESTDTLALDQIEGLAASIMPSKTSFKVFTLKHTYAKDVVYLLKDIFKEDDKKSGRSEFAEMYFGYGSSSSQSRKSSLSKRRPLKFVADSLTNTILVTGADDSQLTEIEMLIELYDRVEPPDSNSVRHTTMITLRYAKATEAAEVIKEVFRDLLSPNDKALVGAAPQAPPQQQGQNDRESSFMSSMFSYLSEDSDSDNVPRFKGMLSLGIDARSNALMVSAPKILLDDVVKMIRNLDNAARPTRSVVKVLRMRQPGTATQVQQAFGQKGKSTGARPGTPGPPGGEPAGGPPQPGQPGANPPGSGPGQAAQGAPGIFKY